MSDTKKSILLSALGLFARDGYEAVPVSAIAGELGITKGALYKHYKNKRDIFDSIVSRMERHDAERANEFQMPTGSVSNMEEEYLRVTVDRLVEYGKAQFRYWTQDSFASSFRRMLTLEQYRSPAVPAVSCLRSFGLCGGYFRQPRIRRPYGKSLGLLWAYVPDVQRI